MPERAPTTPARVYNTDTDMAPTPGSRSPTKVAKRMADTERNIALRIKRVPAK
jgi:hypothetical protein